MSDLFLLADERLLLAKWDYLFSLLGIVARDYQDVLQGRRAAMRHRLLLLQASSDLIDLNRELERLACPSPSEGLKDWQHELWAAARDWATLHREWRIPPEGLAEAELCLMSESRSSAEHRLNTVILRYSEACEADEAKQIGPRADT